MADYSLLGTFSTGGASTLNADLIDKLKNAERESVLTTIDNQLEKITGVDADTKEALDFVGESSTLAVIKAQTLDLLSKVSQFDLDSSTTTAFDTVSASTTGTAAVFDAVDVGGLEPGTTNITVSQLAQRDVYQSDTFNASTKDGGVPIVSDTADNDGTSDDDTGDDLALLLSSKLSVTLMDTDLTGKLVSNDTVNLTDTISGKITIGTTEFNTGTEITDFNNDGSITVYDMITAINNEGTYTASVGSDGRLIIANADDSTTSISISNNLNLAFSEFNYAIHEFNAVTDTSVTSVSNVSMKGLSDFVDEINANDDLIASIETVGVDQYKIVIKSAEAGLNNALKIEQTNLDFGFSNESSTTAISSLDDVISGSVTINGTVYSTEPGFGDVDITDLDTSGAITYRDLQATLEAQAGLTASFDSNNKLVIETVDNYFTASGGAQTGSYSKVEITNDTLGLGFDYASRTQVAQNLNANIDGVDYDTNSNTVTIQGNLTMTAVETGNATIDIQRDTSTIMTGLQSVIESYNSLSELIETESQNPDSSISDISTLRGVLSDIKEMLFTSYGQNADLNLFNYGLELDLEGKLSLDTTEFGQALVDNYDNIKDLLLGNTTDSDTASSDSTKFLGLGTLLQDYIDNLDSYDSGLFTRYETSISERKEDLEKEREETLEALDAKYASMANQFAQYAAVISQLESAFSGLSLMIDQSVARN